MAKPLSHFMILFRVLLFLVVAWFAWHTVRRWIRGVQAQARGTTNTDQRKPLPGGKIVKCSYCEVHLPEREAVQKEDEWFCSTEHARLYLSRR